MHVCRVESFIEHQDTCNAGRARADPSPACGPGSTGVAAASAGSQPQAPPPMSLSRTASSTSPSSDIVISPVAAWPGSSAPTIPSPATAAFHRFEQVPSPRTPPSDHHHRGGHNLELQLMPPSGSGVVGRGAPGVAEYGVAPRTPAAPPQSHPATMQLQLSIGVCGGGGFGDEAMLAAAREKEEVEAREQLRQAVAEKAAANEARAQARRHAELAEQELASAKRMRRQAQVELSRAHALREHAVRQVNATLLQITCLGCRHKFRARPQLLDAALVGAPEVTCSYMSSVVTEGGDAEADDEPPLLDGRDGMLQRRQHAMAMDIVL
jgi:hypothetical protein